MKTVLTISIFLYSSFCWCSDESRALRYVQRAIVKYPAVKKTTKKIEKKAFKYIPFSKKTVGYVGGVTIAAIRGGINTNAFKNVNFKFLGGNCQPNIEYKFDGTMSSTININWEW